MNETHVLISIVVVAGLGAWSGVLDRDIFLLIITNLFAYLGGRNIERSRNGKQRD